MYLKSIPKTKGRLNFILDTNWWCKNKKPGHILFVCPVYDIKNDALAFHLFQLRKQSLILCKLWCQNFNIILSFFDTDRVYISICFSSQIVGLTKLIFSNYNYIIVTCDCKIKIKSVSFYVMRGNKDLPILTGLTTIGMVL